MKVMSFEKFGIRKEVLATALVGLGLVVGTISTVSGADAAPKSNSHSDKAMAQACWCEERITTSNLNLRTDPSTDADIILVMPEGSSVQAGLHPDSHIDGFVGVYYYGTFGYAYEEFLSSGDGGDTETYPMVGFGTINDSVNFREGPGVDYAVQEVLHVGTLVAMSDEVVNGYRYIQYGGMDGWVYDEFLTEGNNGGYMEMTMVTTSDLNLRDGAALDGEILIVIPEGAEVEANSQVVDGFRSVTYGGYQGWAYDEYLL